MTRDLLLPLIKFLTIHGAFGEMDLGQRRGEPDLHGVGRRRGGGCSAEVSPTFGSKGWGKRWEQGREERLWPQDLP